MVDVILSLLHETMMYCDKCEKFELQRTCFIIYDSIAPVVNKNNAMSFWSEIDWHESYTSFESLA